MGERVVFVGAEEALVDSIRADLAGMGVALAAVPPGRAATRALSVAPPALVLVAHDPPASHAFDLLRELRGGMGLDRLPVIVVGRSASASLDSIVSFELGADDFVPDDAGHREIALRARAVLRRVSAGDVLEGTSVRAGALELDVARHTVTADGRPVELTALEFKLLLELARHRDRVVRREDLFERIWAGEAREASRALDTTVKRIREKLGPLRDLVETVRGVGYRVVSRT